MRRKTAGGNKGKSVTWGVRVRSAVKPHRPRHRDMHQLEFRRRSGGYSGAEFARFRSSNIEQDFGPAKMDRIRGRLREHGLKPCDGLSSHLMDAITSWLAKN